VEIMVATVIMVAAFFPLVSMMRSGARRAKFQKKMKDLVERWTKRAELFYVKPHIVSGTWDEPLAARKMAILAVTTSWKEDFQRKDNLQALKDDLSNGVLQGSSSLTMFAIVGEGLFHAASEADPATTP
jgi:hypothetical protein